MKREWKPGDLAVVTTRSGATYMATYHFAPGVNYFWNPLPGQAAPNPSADPDSSAHPLVVIDPEDREAVSRLRVELAAHYVDDDDLFGIDVALREFANPTPPKPEEPTGLGAVVEDADGERWVWMAQGAEGAHWHRVGFPEKRANWHDIAAVRVLSEGVSA